MATPRSSDPLTLSDVWENVAVHLVFSDICSCRRVCTTWRTCLIEHEFEIARRYARNVLRDERFWEHAMRRPVHARKSLSTWHAEVVRVDAFRRETVDFIASDFYKLWEAVDGHESTSV